jgi:GxxExxY protein
MRRDDRTYAIIGAAMEVHRELGCGFLEPVYQEALEREFSSSGIPFAAQPILEIIYKGKPLKKKYQPDFICFEKIVVEIKALDALSGDERAQILNYLKATGFETGLLINFGGRSLQYERFIHDPQITQIHTDCLKT